MIGIEWFYQGIEQYKYITTRYMTFKVLSFVLMFILVRKKSDYVIYGRLAIFSNIFANALNRMHSQKYISWKLTGNYCLTKHLGPVLYFLAITAATSIYTNMDSVMIGFMRSNTEVGYYNLSVKIEQVLVLVVTALGPVLLPRIGYHLSNGDEDNFYRLLNKSIQFVSIIALPVMIYFIIMAPSVIDVLGGSKYMDAVNSLRVILLSIFPVSLGNIARVQILAPQKKEKLSMYAAFIGVVVNLIINALLIPVIGIIGAALGTLITESIVAGVQIWHSKNIFKAIIKSAAINKIIFAVLVACFVLIGLLNLIHLPSILLLILTVIIYMVIYGIILILTREPFVTFYFNLYSDKLINMLDKRR